MKGIVALYPQLTFASLSAVCSAAFNDAQNLIEHQINYWKRVFPLLRLATLWLPQTIYTTDTQNKAETRGQDDLEGGLESKTDCVPCVKWAIL